MQPHGAVPVPKHAIVLPRSADGSSFAIYRTAAASHGAITLPEGTTPQDFFIDAATWQLPHAMVSHVRSCAQVVTRGPAEVALDVAPTINMFLRVAGEGHIACDGQVTRSGPGDITVVDSLRAHESTNTAFDARIVWMARDRVPFALLGPGVHGLTLPGAQAGTRLLAAAMKALVGEMDALGLVEAEGAVAALCQLAATVVAAELIRRDRDRRRFADPQLDGAMAFIERGVNDPAMTTEMVRRHVGISRSALYRLFAPLGGVDAVIRQRRLDGAMRSLLADAGAPPSIAALAVRHGFPSTINFARTFQARFGVTPVQFGRKIATGDRAWLMDQARRAGFATLEAWLAALTTGRGANAGTEPDEGDERESGGAGDA